MALAWSFSLDRCFRRCQRQFFFREIAASHNAKDPLRREAFILKQVKSIELWRGLLIHAGIEQFVVPCWAAGRPIDWNQVVQETQDMARAQLWFSENQLYRAPGTTKSRHPLEYCALFPHELGGTVSAAEEQRVSETIAQSFRNLAEMGELLRHIRGRQRYWAELPVL